MTCAIIDYGSGNLHSAAKAFERASMESGAEVPIVVTAEPDAILKAERIVLPGVGAFADCYHGLERVPGMMDALNEAVRVRGKPFLGICVGMQLMADRGLEHGDWPGLGWIAGVVKAVEPRDPSLKIPHMGWNTLIPRRPHALLQGIPIGDKGWHAYFVHSFHFDAAREESLVAETDYSVPLTAIIGEANLAGTQFHPEKSQRLGLALIANFLRWRP